VPWSIAIHLYVWSAAHEQSEREEDEAAGKKLADLDRDLLRLLAEHRAVVREYRGVVCRALLNEGYDRLASEPLGSPRNVTSTIAPEAWWRRAQS
jgi:signal transduction histidine kinase